MHSPRVAEMAVSRDDRSIHQSPAERPGNGHSHRAPKLLAAIGVDRDARSRVLLTRTNRCPGAGVQFAGAWCGEWSPPPDLSRAERGPSDIRLFRSPVELLRLVRRTILHCAA